MWSNPQFPMDLTTFTEEILNGKLHFLCSERISFTYCTLIVLLCWLLSSLFKIIPWSIKWKRLFHLWSQSFNIPKLSGFCGFGHIYHLHLLHLPLRISSLNVTKIYQLHLLKNSLMENFIFCAVKLRVNRYPERRIYFYKSYQNILK